MRLEAERRGRTQEDVARVIGRDQGYVAQLMTFGRFCRFILEDIAIAINTETARFVLLRTRERLFRKYWTETKAIGNTVQRYREIFSFAEAERRGRTQIDIANALGLSEGRVSQLLEFGRFCRFALAEFTAVNSSETTRFTLLRTRERLFRKYWTETKAIGNTVQRLPDASQTTPHSATRGTLQGIPGAQTRNR